MRRFVVTERELVTNKQPLDSWITARLFYGVPQWAKWVHKETSTGNLIFTDKKL